MACNMFTLWLCVDSKMRKKLKKILLFADNCSALWMISKDWLCIWNYYVSQIVLRSVGLELSNRRLWQTTVKVMRFQRIGFLRGIQRLGRSKIERTGVWRFCWIWRWCGCYRGAVWRRHHLFLTEKPTIRSEEDDDVANNTALTQLCPTWERA